MSLSSQNNSSTNQIFNSYKELCSQLNVNNTSLQELVWKNFESIQKEVVDGDPIQWLGCMLFLQSRQNIDDCQQIQNEGELPPPFLYHVFDLTKMGPNRFFEICDHFHYQIQLVDRIQDIYEVGLIMTCTKFNKIFNMLFDNTSEDYEKIYQFGLMFFCYFRIQPTFHSYDYLCSLYLLLSCHEILFQETLSSGLLDSLHPELESNLIPEILELLCLKCQVNVKYVKDILHTKLEPAFKELKTNKQLICPIFANYSFNVQSLRRLYEKQLRVTDVINELNHQTSNADCLREAVIDKHHSLKQILINYQNSKLELIKSVGYRWLIDMRVEFRSKYENLIVDYEDAFKLTIIVLNKFLQEQQEAYDQCDSLSQNQNNRVNSLLLMLNKSKLPHAIFECCVRLIAYWHGNKKVEWTKGFVEPFHVQIVVQPFTRAMLEYGLCVDATRFMLEIEDHIVSSFIFETNSIFWNLVSPTQDIPDSDEWDCSSITRESANASTICSALAMSRIYLFASKHIDDLCCKDLSLSDSISRRCWYVMERILREDIECLKGRTLDQIIACVVFIVAKASGKPISFRNIIRIFQDKGKGHILARVLLNRQTKDYGNIILFYNKIFVKNYKHIVCQLIREYVTPQNSPQLKSIPYQRHKMERIESPLKGSTRYGRYVSPRKETKLSTRIMWLTNGRRHFIDDFEILSSIDHLIVPEETKTDEPNKKRASDSEDEVIETKRSRLNQAFDDDDESNEEHDSFFLLNESLADRNVIITRSMKRKYANLDQDNVKRRKS